MRGTLNDHSLYYKGANRKWKLYWSDQIMPLYYKDLTNGLQYAPGWLLVSSVRSVISSDIYKLNCQDLGGYSSVSHCGGPASIQGQSVWNLWWTMWQQDEFFFSPPQYFGFPLSEWSRLNVRYTLLLSEGRKGDGWELSKTSAISAVGERWINEYFYT